MNTVHLLVVLQNPWARGRLAETGYNPAVWRREFKESRSGRRLQIAIPIEHAWRVHFTNACPRLGTDADARFEPHLPHLRRALKRVEPDIVLACGTLAESALATVWPGPLVCVPHPAYRLVTNNLYDAAAQILRNWRVMRDNPGWRGQFNANPLARAADADAPRIAIRQQRGRYEIQPLEVR